MNKTIFESYNDTKNKLKSFGVEDYVSEAKIIIKYVTNLSSAQILSNYTQKLTDYQQNLLTAIINQRKIRYPLQYITGVWSFFGRDFSVGPGVLIPRFDTETLVDFCIEKLKGKKDKKVLDLCSGTGCIGITVALETKAQTICLEKYDEALRYLKKNAEKLNSGVNIVKGDVLKGDCGGDKYDIIVSNPPYIDKADMSVLQPEVTFEPETALFGGDDGLNFYRSIARNYRNSLKEDGILVFEIGAYQRESVENILRENGFLNIGSKKDCSGFDRVVFGTPEKI